MRENDEIDVSGFFVCLFEMSRQIKNTNARAGIEERDYARHHQPRRLQNARFLKFVVCFASRSLLRLD